jgi:hypothetical protein
MGRHVHVKIFSMEMWAKNRSREARLSMNFLQTKYHRCIFCKNVDFLEIHGAPCHAILKAKKSETTKLHSTCRGVTCYWDQALRDGAS